MVTDIKRSLNFYEAGLALTVKNVWVPQDRMEWCWLEREGMALMLQEYRPGNPNVDAIKGTGVSIWFMCNDALLLFEEFKTKDISFEEPFVGNGMWDVHIIDPDGYSLHFESPTDIPEETKYYEWLKSK